MKEKTFEQLNREFDSLCEKIDPYGRCKVRNGEGRCPCFRMNCCHLPEDEVTRQDLIDGIEVLRKAMSGSNQEEQK